MTRTTTAMGSGEATARRRERRRGGEKFGGEILRRQQFKSRRRDQREVFGGRREFQFQREPGQRIFLLRIFSSGDRFADRAQMLAVESPDDRRRKRRSLQVVRQHRRPRDGLQGGPMQARREDERSDHCTFAEAGEHGTNLERIWPGAQVARRQPARRTVTSTSALFLAM